MPLYEYRCRSCGRRFSLFFRTFAQAEREAGEARCPTCGGRSLARAVSKPTILRGSEARLQALEDPSRLGALDSEDPRAMAGLLREMSAALDEPMDEQTSEMVDRLEAGEPPAALGASLPDAEQPSGLIPPD